MSKRKNVFYCIILTSALLLSFGTLQVFAANSNHGDTPFTYEFPSTVSTAYTDTRPKYNSTSAYMRLEYLSDSSKSYLAKVVDKNGNNFSRTWSYRFTSSNINQGIYMKNYALEDNNNNPGVQVKIRADRAGYSPFVAKGDWSPDSI